MKLIHKNIVEATLVAICLLNVHSAVAGNCISRSSTEAEDNVPQRGRALPRHQQISREQQKSPDETLPLGERARLFAMSAAALNQLLKQQSVIASKVMGVLQTKLIQGALRMPLVKHVTNAIEELLGGDHLSIVRGLLENSQEGAKHAASSAASLLISRLEISDLDIEQIEGVAKVFENAFNTITDKSK